MSARYPTVTLLITAAAYCGFAIWLGLDPRALLTAFGIEVTTPAMLTEIRAFYGGIELGIAVTMLVLWRRRETFAALLIGGLPLAGSACGRLAGLIVDGYSAVHAGFAVFETVGCVACLAGCYLIAKGESLA